MEAVYPSQPRSAALDWAHFCRQPAKRITPGGRKEGRVLHFPSAFLCVLRSEMPAALLLELTLVAATRHLLLPEIDARQPERLTEQVGGCPDLLVLLVDLDDPTVVDRMHDLTCPRSAALVRRLLARGLDPNRRGWLGKTFLHARAASRNRSIAAVFLDAAVAKNDADAIESLLLDDATLTEARRVSKEVMQSMFWTPWAQLTTLDACSQKCEYREGGNAGSASVFLQGG